MSVKILEKKIQDAQADIWKEETVGYKRFYIFEAYLSPVCMNGFVEKEYSSLSTWFDEIEKKQHRNIG